MEALLLLLSDLLDASGPALLFLLILVGVCFAGVVVAVVLKGSRYRRPAIIAAVIPAALFMLVVATDLFFHEALVRAAVSQANKRPGLKVDFESASGSFIRGTTTVRGLKVDYIGPGGGAARIAVGEVAVQYRVFDVLDDAPELIGATIDGLKGQWVRGEQSQAVKSVKEARHYTLGRLHIMESRVLLNDAPNGVTLDVAVETLHTTPLRSTRAVFDLLYRSQATASINGKTVTLASYHDVDVILSKCVFEELPLELLRAHVSFPFKYLADGQIGLTLDQRWDDAQDDVSVDMDVDMSFANLTPATSGLKSKLAWRFLSRMSPTFHLKFNLKVDGTQTVLNGRNIGAALWKPLRRGVAFAMGNVLKIPVDDMELVVDVLKTGAKAQILRLLMRFLER